MATAGDQRADALEAGLTQAHQRLDAAEANVGSMLAKLDKAIGNISDQDKQLRSALDQQAGLRAQWENQITVSVNQATTVLNDSIMATKAEIAKVDLEMTNRTDTISTAAMEFKANRICTVLCSCFDLRY